MKPRMLIYTQKHAIVYSQAHCEHTSAHYRLSALILTETMQLLTLYIYIYYIYIYIYIYMGREGNFCNGAPTYA